MSIRTAKIVESNGKYSVKQYIDDRLVLSLEELFSSEIVAEQIVSEWVDKGIIMNVDAIQFWINTMEIDRLYNENLNKD
jgi:hypothetical protein